MVDFDGLWTAAATHLDALFKDGSHRARKERLRDVYETTEAWWERYVDLIPDRTVRYLMIAEAPPWNSEYDHAQRISNPVYALNPQRGISPLLRQCHRTFYPDTPCDDAQEALQRIAAKGFLLLDGLPFALSYSKKRGNKPYAPLQRHMLDSYVRLKLRQANLAWTTNLRTIFGYQNHALAFIQAADGILHLPSRDGVLEIPISPANIVGNNQMPGVPRMRLGFGL